MSFSGKYKNSVVANYAERGSEVVNFIGFCSGQGAPLVPIGDEMLFREYNYCLNLGGISNISFNENGNRKAFDIGICNIALNELAQKLNFNFDAEGGLARSGAIDTNLLTQLNDSIQTNYINQQSLGYEWYLAYIKDMLDANKSAIENKLRTCCELIAQQIATVIRPNSDVLITGGGAKNKFLIECIQSKSQCNMIIPKEQIIDFKEALVFAFLGFLRANEQANALKIVTGATKNTAGGCIYLP